MNIFDDMASTWNAKPDRVERTRIVAERLRKAIDFTAVDSGLEYGCGTGELSFALADVLPHCLLIDTSMEMLKEAERGTVDRKLAWDTERRDLSTRAADHPRNFADVVLCLQVLHHIDDLETTITNMAAALKPGGQIALIDLPKGSSGFHHGSGHDSHENPHLDGLDRDELGGLLQSAGFLDITWHDDITLERDTTDGKVPYSLFLVTGRL